VPSLPRARQPVPALHFVRSGYCILARK
jgi:hypothetical protein